MLWPASKPHPGICVISIKNETDMVYIIHGATGAQGSPVYKLLIESSLDARGAVRDPAAV